MGNTPSKNLEKQRRELNGVTYFDRGTVTGKNGRKYDRFAIQTHFVEVGEDQAELVKRYVLPISREGDVLSFGAKVMAMCTRNVFTKEQVRPGFWAKLLSPHASETVAGIGMHDPYKLQLAINMVGAPRVVFASVVSAITKPFGVKGLFYKIVGKGVAGIDGFYYRSSFERYKDLALVNNENAQELCDELEQKTGIPVVLMDANDIDQNQLGKCGDFPLTDEEIQDAMADNPSGQGGELTPLILIRPLS
ncbi:F420-0--gamma-glutamyl ligase [Clostridiales bacterium]|nr:F420-0--gamma-glutamyl ligase [Clostridiales bacterium]